MDGNKTDEVVSVKNGAKPTDLGPDDKKEGSLGSVDPPNWVFEFDEEVKLRANEHEETEWEAKRSDYEESCSPSDSELMKLENCKLASGETIVADHKTPHSYKRSNSQRVLRQRKHRNSCTSPPPVRHTPIPILAWADCDEVWQNMIYKEEATLKCRDPSVFGNRTSYLPRMRAILLDWIMEVCEVYRLRRVTYHLAVDYLDRYLSMKPNVPKTQLQLLGVSCLFIAAKLEEIYPPKLSEFSYVCDGACTDNQILSCEILLLSCLGWDVNPMTPSGWLNLYMQIHYNAKEVAKHKLHEGMSTNFQFPQYSGYQFVRASHLIDLFTMDPGYLKFSYSIIAAGAMYYTFGKQVALLVSGLTWDRLEPCVKYMSVFNKILNSSKDLRLQTVGQQESDERLMATFRSIRTNCPNLISDENHALQTHIVDLECYEKTVVLRLEEMGHIFPLEEMRTENFPIEILKNDIPPTPEFLSAENEDLGHRPDSPSELFEALCKEQSSSDSETDDKEKIPIDDIISFLTAVE